MTEQQPETPVGPHAWAEHYNAAREQAPQPGRHTADTVTDDDLDQLYAERQQLLAELDGRSEEARERWIKKQLNETGLKSMDFRNGMTMDIEPARDMVAQWVGAARAMLGDAENYSETPIEMVVKVAEDPERFAFTLQRVGKLTPHQARQRAEAAVARVCAELDRIAALPTVDRGEDRPDRFSVGVNWTIRRLRDALNDLQEPTMAKKIIITDTAGETTETVVSDDATARHYENLPFETDHIASVTVTDAPEA
ncbi:hypothetical protein [Streptomyces subrutilus]|uniref:hypothetical protein n=1 Tax=Streptomyces subrutilus TaxID=36818 RepID=UPI002E15662B|nr:hypothetical protein OG479_32815 [Streptomyces subrutilus]